MGCGSSSANENGAEVYATPSHEVNISSNIDKDLEKQRLQEEKKIKLLLLGAGESGKSTIFKQMRILYGKPRNDEDLRLYGVVARSNTVVAIRKLAGLLKALELEGELEDESKDVYAEAANDHCGITPKDAYDQIMTQVVDPGPNAPQADDKSSAVSPDDWVGTSSKAGLAANADAKLFLNHVEVIRVLWQSNTMKKVWAKRAMANVIDGHKEYLQDLSRLSSADYRPSAQDILLARVRTTQVVMERYRIDNIDFEMYDVGGQRSERRKWLDCFDEVDAVIFVAALSEYDQTLAEAKRTNRMVEALELFRSVCNNRAFRDTSIMLFLNKKDIFAEKIMYSDIASQRPFADYAGDRQDFDQGVLYFIQKFKDCLVEDEFSDNFIHVTCATDTNNMEFVLDSTKTIIMTDNLRRSGFLGMD
mmetsp:Transcript_26026/g.29966  ORF Transcript_26026/g.29966 Transcript_26026/m.29966 type:complete len:419 (+) Transcript_26026:102-1358(+)|eukprot:CAMPEP_0194384274 /NCGR_PEP_ID=MMETSP0174-20130528/73006_1 /TAXON_ID=216777 /ORGANISM="Proboscia alata, Strain PI-D3" /LENGTH=418 /DNA_ID=CAMNT_0039171309 /DNA_START=75 /DNA_END=1331 /DNA_ORIENTATION=-